MRQLSLIVVAVTLCLTCGAQTGGLETIGPPTDLGVPNAVVQVLESHGNRLKVADGSVLCDIWLRKSVPTQTAKKESEGLLYPEFSESTLIGVILFPKTATDFRGQPIAAGTYSLRYELMPDDGNHLGVAPDRDFLLLVPAALDSDPVPWHLRLCELQLPGSANSPSGPMQFWVWMHQNKPSFDGWTVGSGSAEMNWPFQRSDGHKFGCLTLKRSASLMAELMRHLQLLRSHA